MTAERFPIEAGHILMFARAIGDDNPAYSEPSPSGPDAGTVLAPPTFVQASAQFDAEYQLRPRQGEPWLGSGREATGIPPSSSDSAGTGLHAEQHFTYHRPLLSGDVLTVQARPGTTWEKEGRRGGKLVFSDSFIEYRNQDGELVITVRSVGVRTERAPQQES